jgi:hypothetical protein
MILSGRTRQPHPKPCSLHCLDELLMVNTLRVILHIGHFRARIDIGIDHSRETSQRSFRLK